MAHCDNYNLQTPILGWVWHIYSGTVLTCCVFSINKNLAPNHSSPNIFICWGSDGVVVPVATLVGVGAGTVLNAPPIWMV